MGLPEVLFDLFPGMGAYSFLCKRVSPQQAEKLMLEGNIFTSEEMHRMGVVDVLVPQGRRRGGRRGRDPHAAAHRRMRALAMNRCAASPSRSATTS